MDTDITGINDLIILDIPIVCIPIVTLIRLYEYLRLITKQLLEPEGTGFFRHLLLKLFNVENATLILIGLWNSKHVLIG